MNKSLYEFMKKLEQTVGTHKFVRCVCLGGIGFLMGMVILPDDVKQEILNNKEEF